MRGFSLLGEFIIGGSTAVVIHSVHRDWHGIDIHCIDLAQKMRDVQMGKS